MLYSKSWLKSYYCQNFSVKILVLKVRFALILTDVKAKVTKLVLKLGLTIVSSEEFMKHRNI